MSSSKNHSVHSLEYFFLIVENQQTSAGCSKFVKRGGIRLRIIELSLQTTRTLFVKWQRALSITSKTFSNQLRILYLKIILCKYSIITYWSKLQSFALLYIISTLSGVTKLSNSVFYMIHYTTLHYFTYKLKYLCVYFKFFAKFKHIKYKIVII